MKLTDTAIKNAKGRDRPYELFDGHGLFRLVNPKERKGWRLTYRFNGKEKLISLGTYPEVSLAKARDRRTDARKLLGDGIDPSVVKRAAKFERLEQGTNTFEAIGRSGLRNTLRAGRNPTETGASGSWKKTCTPGSVPGRSWKLMLLNC